MRQTKAHQTDVPDRVLGVIGGPGHADAVKAHAPALRRGPATAIGRRQGVDKIAVHRQHQASLAGSDLPIGKPDAGSRQAHPHGGVAHTPQKIEVRSQHQAATHRGCTAAAAARKQARFNAPVGAHGQTVCQFGSAHEKTASVACGGAIHGRARQPMGRHRHQVAAAQHAHGLAARQIDVFKAQPAGHRQGMHGAGPRAGLGPCRFSAHQAKQAHQVSDEWVHADIVFDVWPPPSKPILA